MQFIITILSVGAALMFAFLLATNIITRNKLANRWLSLHSICIFFLCLDDVFTVQNIYTSYPYLYGFTPVFSLLLTPSLYFATKFYTNPAYQLNWKDSLHFLPLILFCFLNGPFFLANNDTKLVAIKSESLGPESLLSLFILLFFLQAFVYSIKMIRQLSRHKRLTTEYSADENAIQLDWLRNFVLTILVILSFWFIEIILASETVTGYFNIVTFIGLFILSYFSLNQQNIFPINQEERDKVLDFIKTKADDLPSKNHKTVEKVNVLTNDELTDLVIKLDQLMKDKKPYLEADINIARLAEYLETNSYKLSHVLNQHYKMNFSTFINDFRVKESVKLLSDPNMIHLNIIQIAYEAGFGSKTVFNTTFKRFTQTTPTQYRKKAIADWQKSQ